MSSLPLTNEEKLQMSLFQMLCKKAAVNLKEDSCEDKEIDITKTHCLLLFARKLCQVYKDLTPSTPQGKEIKALIISYLKMIYHTDIPKTVKTEIEKFIKTLSVKKCDAIISSIYNLDIEEFYSYVLAFLITHINKGNPLRKNKEF